MKPLALAVLLALAAATAHALPAPPARTPERLPPLSTECGPQLAPEGKLVQLDPPLTEAHRLGLSASIFLALADETGAWPEEQVKQGSTCAMARFEAAGSTWTIYGGAGRTPPRFATTSNRAEILFLAVAPGLPEAEAWQRTRSGGLKVERPIYYLVGTTPGSLRYVLRAYDGGPSMATLTADLTAAIEGRLTPLATYDATGAAVTVTPDTQTRVMAELFQPGYAAPGQPATLLGPDGRFFRPGVGGSVVLRGSGLTCAQTAGELPRVLMAVMAPDDATLDLSCRFGVADSWITLFVTRIADRSGDSRGYAERLAAAQKGGVARDLPTIRTPVSFGKAWIDKADAGQGLWLIRHGDYLVEIRTTFSRDGYERVLAGVEAIAKSVGAPA